MNISAGSWPDRPRVLIAYPYAKTLSPTAWARFGGYDLILDSGAFTAYQSGTPIDLEAYTEYCAEHRDRFRFAFALDVIGDHARTVTNYRAQRHSLGDDFPLVPTWHTSPNLYEFEELASLAPYISIGGAVRYLRRRKALGRIVLAAHKIADRIGVRIHALGMAGSVANDMPWESADSASWTIPQRRPLAYLATRNGTMTSFRYGCPIPAGRQRDTVRAYGGDPDAMERYGFSSAKHVGRDLAKRRTDWAVVSAIRSYMWQEAAKRRREGSEFCMFLAVGAPDVRIDLAHRLGPPRWKLGGPVADRDSGITVQSHR